jgi:hypothetical protein
LLKTFVRLPNSFLWFSAIAVDPLKKTALPVRMGPTA